MFQPLLVAALAATAAAIPQHAHQHLHYRRAGTAVTGTGSPYANSTGGIYANSTIATSVATTASVTVTADDDTVTVTVQPVPVSSDSAAADSATTAAASTGSAAATGACAASRSTTTKTATEYVTVTVGASSSSASSSTYVAPASTSSSSSAVVETSADAFFASSASSSSTSASSSSVYVAASSSAYSYSSSSVASSSTVSSTSSSASATSTSSSSSSKRGLAYNEASLTELFEGKDVGWAYNWADSAGGSILSGLEYVPQIWCTSTSYDDWVSAAESAISSGSEHLLSFNEPDESSQCDISASDAATAHQTYMNPLSSKAKIGSPAVTNGGSPMGLTYMQSFLDACDSKCDIDFLVIHWYSSYYDGVDSDFKSHVQDAISLASDNGISEVWITEFALDDASDSDSATFLESVLPWLDSESAVGRYAFYMVADGLLTDGDAISEILGAAYVASSD